MRQTASPSNTPVQSSGRKKSKNAAATDVFIAIDPSDLDNEFSKYYVVCRVYRSLNSASNTVEIQIYTKDNTSAFNGRQAVAKAFGFGYHRPSAALHDAITMVGIELKYPIDGVGDTAMIEAIAAIAKDICGVERPVVIKTHL
jgi:hypothetical protein